MERHIIRKSAFASLLIAGSAMTMLAQPSMNRGPNPNAPKLMVSACRTTDKALAVLCADKLRTQIEGDVSFRVLYVNPKTDVENVLSASGYDPAVALAPADAMALAKQIHADMYIDATVEKTAAGFKVAAAAVLSRDASMVQPLGVFENAKIEQVAQMASRSFREVFEKSFDDTKNCFTYARERKTAEAQKAIAAVMKDYPKSVWIRQCNYQLLKDTRAAKAEVLKAAEDLATVTPEDKKLLRELVIMYGENGNKEKQLEFLEKLYAADPNDAKLCGETVGSLAGLGKIDRAYELAQKCAAQFQGDVPIIQNYWLLSRGKDNKQYVTVGKQMVMLDSTLADSSYYDTMMRAANADSNFVEAAQFADAGGKKWPKAHFNTFANALWTRAGNAGKASEALGRAAAANPNDPSTLARVAGEHLKADPPKFDEAIAIAKQLQGLKADPALVAGIAVQSANSMMSKNSADSLKAKGADGATIRASLTRIYETAAWADTLATGTSLAAQGKFIFGVAAMQYGILFLQDAGELGQKYAADVRAIQPPNAAKQKAITEVMEPQICAQVAKANEFVTISQTAVPAGGRFDPKLAQQVMGSLMQINGNIDQYKKAYHCK